MGWFQSLVREILIKFKFNDIQGCNRRGGESSKKVERVWKSV